MTTKINRLFCTTLLITLFCFQINAQTTEAIAKATTPQPDQTLISTAAKTGTEVSLPKNLEQNFNSLFKSVTDVKWTLSGDSYFGSFTSGGKKHNVTFNGEGQFVYAKIYCKQEHLSKSIQQMLKKDFSSFAVYDVIEIRTPETVGYQVILQNEKQYVDLRFNKDGALVTKKLMDRTDVQ